jgi:hypothetical protein
MFYIAMTLYGFLATQSPLESFDSTIMLSMRRRPLRVQSQYLTRNVARLYMSSGAPQ